MQEPSLDGYTVPAFPYFHKVSNMVFPSRSKEPGAKEKKSHALAPLHHCTVLVIPPPP
jgi:hypothetical protein